MHLVIDAVHHQKPFYICRIIAQNPCKFGTSSSLTFIIAVLKMILRYGSKCMQPVSITQYFLLDVGLLESLGMTKFSLTLRINY